jgi:16S rRNA processing protein RimM
MTVARIARPHGVRGEVRAEIVTSHPDRLRIHPKLYLASPRTPEICREVTVERVRLHGDAALLKIDGCDDRNAAETMRGLLVQIPVEDAVPLEDDEFYDHQIVGLQVETEDGERLGTVAEVLATGADDVYVVRGIRGEILLPAVSDVVQVVDLERGLMVIRVLPGLLGQDEA